jgi:hypothetical protein
MFVFVPVLTCFFANQLHSLSTNTIKLIIVMWVYWRVAFFNASFNNDNIILKELTVGFKEELPTHTNKVCKIKES